MAKQRDSKLVGTVGTLIFYNRLGEYCMRTKPATVRRSKASVNSGLNFGKASKISRQIRSLVEAINPSKSNIQAVRLNGTINRFISWKEKKDAASATMPRKLPFIYGFQFNDQADLSSINAIQPSVKTIGPGLTEISLSPLFPSQSLQAPANTNIIILKMILMVVRLEKAETELLGKTEIEIPYSNETFQPPVASFPAASKPGDLVILVMAVQYMVNKNEDVQLLNDIKKLPCGVGWAGIVKETGRSS
jgi:hypothetical protein